MERGPDRQRNARGEGARLRDEVVEAAIRIIERTGHDGSITLRAVAREVGVAPPSLYRHFDTPTEILGEVLVRSLADFAAVLGAAGAGVEPARERLVVRSTAFVEFVRTRPQRYRLLFERSPDTSVWGLFASDSPVVAACAAAFGAFSDVVRQAQVEAGAADANAATDAALLWAGLHGYAVLRPGNPDISWPSSDRDAIEALVMRTCGLAGPMDP